jgi:hypothetical protein
MTDEKDWGRVGPKGPPSMIYALRGRCIGNAEAVWIEPDKIVDAA